MCETVWGRGRACHAEESARKLQSPAVMWLQCKVGHPGMSFCTIAALC